MAWRLAGHGVKTLNGNALPVRTISRSRPRGSRFTDTGPRSATATPATDSSTDEHTNMRSAYLLLIAALSLPLHCLGEDLLRQASELIEAGQGRQALELFTRAAAAGDPIGEYGLGVLYFQGSGVARDIDESTRHFRAAAQRGHVLAQYNLGNAYLHGRGVEKSLDDAEFWWRKASVAGYVRAQYNLGTLLLENAGTEELKEEGIAWLRASAERGFPKAAEKLQNLEEPLTLEPGAPGSARDLLRSEARLLTLDPKFYSIQLFSGRQAASADNFIAEHGLADQALPFRFRRGEDVWIGVLYGLYEHGGDAKQTLGGLKETLKDAGPWLRPLAEIQDSIRAAWRVANASAAVSND
jgi:hypothetical protein